MTDKAVVQYLQRYAEPETTLLADWPPDHHYRHVLLIPAYHEPADFLATLLQSACFTGDVLLILVINQPDGLLHQSSAQPPDTLRQQQLFTEVINRGELIWQHQNLTLLTSSSPDRPSHHLTQHPGGDILLVDRFTRPLPAQQGVGLARKLAADLALALMQRGLINSRWLCTTDADAVLPANYFTALNHLDPQCRASGRAVVAGCYGFEHVRVADDAAAVAVEQATLLYQQALRYYVAGLKYAGSPYAFFTLGSTLAVEATAYARVRGFPKRAAGEDFYLLNKLAKLGAIAEIPATLCLQARLSDRVPYGTGVSTARIMQQLQAGEHFCYYHPQCFQVLRAVLTHFGDLWPHRTAVQTWQAGLPLKSIETLQALGLLTFIDKQLTQCRTQPQFDAQLHGWFDGLKTLRFIHGVRDLHCPDIPLCEAQAAFAALSQ